MSSRRYKGPALDATYQHISERPFGADDGETVYATEPDAGREVAENVPVPETTSPEPVDETGQTAITDWGGGRA